MSANLDAEQTDATASVSTKVSPLVRVTTENGHDSSPVHRPPYIVSGSHVNVDFGTYPHEPNDTSVINLQQSGFDTTLSIDPSVLLDLAWLDQELSDEDKITQPRQEDAQSQDTTFPNIYSTVRDQSDGGLSQSSHGHTTTPENDKRFSTASLRVLNRWLSSHVDRPYPAVGDVEIMSRQSGLNKKQILTWFANARRRKNLWASPSPKHNASSSNSTPREIPHQRPPTPIVQQLNPFERWRNSPPEHEPASVPAIARAVLGASQDPGTAGDKDDNLENAQSLSIASSVTGAETTQSSQSSQASAYSHSSEASIRSLEFLKRTKKKRRRRGYDRTKKKNGQESLLKLCHPYQCTFCTETFKTKHSWQRHEKSLHLSLEQWECSPEGPTAVNSESQVVCVYCGFVDPPESHFEIHNQDFCQSRHRDERIFSRKDHLGQHLRLVHGCEFIKWSMEGWKFTHEQIRSRCGFCNLEMQSWTERASHLAKHFKEGNTMADWKGGWGFDQGTLDMVEDSMPPYLIDFERNSPLPFTTQQGAPYSSAGAFELIELELEYFATNFAETNHCEPSDQALHFEACCIIFGAELVSRKSSPPQASSWLRDLLMASEDVAKKAKVRPMKSAARSRFTPLKIHAKDNIFEDCKLEASLRRHVTALRQVNVEPDNSTLQREACSIINDSSGAWDRFSKLLIGLVYNSTVWLDPFRFRAGLTATEPMPLLADTNHLPPDLHLIGLSKQLVDGSPKYASPELSPDVAMPDPSELPGSHMYNLPGGLERGLVLADGNSYRGLWRDLSRFAVNAMSPFNPTSHIPTDEELQYQARWIMYDSDDPWNQSPADNPDWLRDFKREAGIPVDD